MNGYSRDGRNRFKTQTGYRDHAPGQVTGNIMATDQRLFDSLQGRRMPPKAYCKVCGLNNHDTNDCYRKWRRSDSYHSNSCSESRRYGRYRRQSKAQAEQRAAWDIRIRLSLISNPESGTVNFNKFDGLNNLCI
ncbi:hypothetical protein DPMN_081132 [Dreissena polymorpha]|uniref:Uncharacterized protein n=1 Tax=Dreissena polymorpha TaxID=45954 RepID=A0A9D3Y891_DREPO|nr:hypothetical protein DPMN_081132 [Dreissena polymorpha]